MHRLRPMARLTAVLLVLTLVPSVSLAQGGGSSAERRPQTPVPPFPYRAVEVEFDSEQAGVRLAGTLTLPEAARFGEGPYPAVLLVTGSGSQDRDETVMFGEPPFHKPFAVIADHLTRAGIAVLRHDDRGVGGSTIADDEIGQSTTTESLADDAAGGLGLLREHEAIDPDRVGVLGHSEGGAITAVLMRRGALNGPAVLLAGTTVSGERVLAGQVPAGWEVQGVPEEELERLTPPFEEAVAAAAAGDEEELREKLRRVIVIQAGVTIEQRIQEALDQQMRFFQNPWMTHFLNYDPAPDLAEARAPVLALFGEKDTQVLSEDNAPVARRLLENGWPEGSEVVVVEDANHFFQEAETGAGVEYVTLDQTIMPRVLEMISGWLTERFGVEPVEGE